MIGRNFRQFTWGDTACWLLLDIVTYPKYCVSIGLWICYVNALNKGRWRSTSSHVSSASIRAANQRALLTWKARHLTSGKSPAEAGRITRVRRWHKRRDGSDKMAGEYGYASAGALVALVLVQQPVVRQSRVSSVGPSKLVSGLAGSVLGISSWQVVAQCLLRLWKYLQTGHLVPKDFKTTE